MICEYVPGGSLTEQLPGMIHHPGTPEYMAPEQADITQPVDVRTDLYALGISLWEIGNPARSS